MFALALGAAQAWTTRFQMNADGVSYLDIGDAYWRGDWHNAINAYWSPLYSWILGGFLKVTRPSMYWEYPLVHLINFLIYAAALFCFDFFLNTFIEYRRTRDRELLVDGQTGLSDSSWRVLGYALFVATSLLLISVGQPTPDMLIAAFFYLASALLVKIGGGKAGVRTFVALGLVLGFAYLAKAVMFPISFIFISCAFCAEAPSARSARRSLVAALVFLLVAGPFVGALSYKNRHFTFGETGAWNYAFYVNHVPYFATDLPGLKHPLRKISSAPPVYEFAEPIAGTFPPWYDPAYWREGVTPHFTFSGELRPIADATKEYGREFFVLFLNVTVGLCILLFTADGLARSLGRVAQSWMIAVPALAILALYSLVHVETRFIGAPVALLFLAGYSGVSFPSVRGRARTASYTVALVAASLLAMVLFGAAVERQKTFGPVYAVAASSLRQHGVKPGDMIGLVWDEDWNTRAAKGAFIPRLLRARIVVEATDPGDFWNLNADARSGTISLMRVAGVRAILAYGIPGRAQAGWKDVAGTGYFAYSIPPEPPR